MFDPTILIFSLSLSRLFIFSPGEMINGRPVFPGTSTINQIERIIEVINMPSKSDVDAIASVYTATMLESLPQMNFKLLGDVFPQASSEAIDLIRSCFHFNPNKRPSAEELLKVSVSCCVLCCAFVVALRHVLFSGIMFESMFLNVLYQVGICYTNGSLYLTLPNRNFSSFPLRCSSTARVRV